MIWTADIAPRAQLDCLRQGPAIVELKGWLVESDYRGLSNFGPSGGDMKLTLLRLDQPICVQGDPSSTGNPGAEVVGMEVRIGAPAGWSHLLHRGVVVRGSLLLHSDVDSTVQILMNAKEVRLQGP